MVAPPQPPVQQGPPVGPGGIAAPSDPQAIVQQVSQQTGAPPELIVAFLQAIPPPAIQEFLQLGPSQQANILAQFMQQTGAGQGPGQPPPQGAPRNDGPPPPDQQAQALPPMPPQGPPPAPVGPPVGPGAPLPDVPPQGPPPVDAAPAKPPKPPDVLESLPKLKDDRKVPPPRVGPDLDLLRKRSKWGKEPPTRAEILDHAEVGRRRYGARNEHYRLVWKLIHLIPKKVRPDGTAIEPLAGEIYHTRSKPAVVYDRSVSIMEPFLDRLIVSTDAWQDDAETVQASQRVENYDRTALENSYRKWDEHGSMGDPQPPFSRKLAGLILGEGLCGRRIFIDPDDDDIVFMEPVPAYELYPLSDATTRQITMPLVEARAHYGEINTAVPQRDKDNPSWNSAIPDDNEEVRIVHWADRFGLWEAITWEWSSWRPGTSGVAVKDDDYWIKKPSPIDFGYCPLRYPPAFLGTPASHMAMGSSDGRGVTTMATDHQAYVNRTMFSALVDSYELMNHLISLVLTTANTVSNPPMVHKINPEHDDAGLFGTDGKRLKPSRALGAVSQIPADEAFEPVPVDPAGTNALATIMQSLADEFGDTAPPVLSGRGEATSGADRFLAQQSAADYILTPAMKAAERWLSDGLREINELIVRKGKGKAKLFTGLTYRVRRADDPQARRNVASVLQPADIEKNGVEVKVRFKRSSLTEMAQRSSYWLQLLDKNVVDLNTVRDELDIEEPERMQNAVLRDKALMDERMLKTLIGQALRKYGQQGGDLDALRTWFEERANENRQAMAQAAAPPGMPSPPGAPAPPGVGGAPPPMPPQ